MGGADNVLRQAKQSFDQGDYRWVAEVVNHVVFADADNRRPSSFWPTLTNSWATRPKVRTMAQFLPERRIRIRRGITKLPVPNTASPDTIRAMPLEMFFDYLGVRLNGDRAAGQTVDFNIELTDTNENYILGVENAAIHYSKDRSIRTRMRPLS